MADEKQDPLVLCSFCEKDQYSTVAMVQGKNSTAICAECVEICNEIVFEKRVEKVILATLKVEARSTEPK